MKKSEFVKELEKIIDMVKAEDDGFEYGDTERYIREGIKDYPLFNNNID